MAKQYSQFEKRLARQIGENVRSRREAKKISRETVAQWIGQTTDAVAKAERGERRFSIADVIRFSLEFECPIEALIGPVPRR